MAAGLGYIEFTTGDVLTAASANGYLASQVVMVFASAAARTSAIASPQEGMISYLKDTNSTEYYSGSAWVAIGGGGAATFVGCAVKKITTAQTLSNATFTAITFNSEDFDTDAFHDNATNNSRITIPTGKGGYYLLTGQISYKDSATGIRGVRIYKNGTYLASPSLMAGASASSYTVVNFSQIVSSVATDYFEIYGYQTSGGNLDVQPDAGYTIYQAQYLGA